MVSPNAAARRKQQQAFQAQQRAKRSLEKEGRRGLLKEHEAAFAVADEVQANKDVQERMRQREVAARHHEHLQGFRKQGSHAEAGAISKAREKEALRHPS